MSTRSVMTVMTGICRSWLCAARTLMWLSSGWKDTTQSGCSRPMASVTALVTERSTVRSIMRTAGLLFVA